MAGVKIYVDAIINHMTGNSGNDIKFGIAGSEYSHYSYADWTYDDFHHNCQDNYGDIGDYGDEWQVRNCELGNLADLKTEDLRVQIKLASYLRKLLDIGVAGFRIDAAKHMYPSDIQKIIGFARDETNNPNPPFIFQEVSLLLRSRLL